MGIDRKIIKIQKEIEKKYASERLLDFSVLSLEELVFIFDLVEKDSSDYTESDWSRLLDVFNKARIKT